MYVILGMHRILVSHLDEYLENVRKHAQNSRSEPGCLRFEVLQDAGDATVISLVEVFRDEDAFRAHQAAPHYHWWMDLSREWRDGAPLLRHVMGFVTPDPA